jgi:AraC-like DNA-binding protein
MAHDTDISHHIKALPPAVQAMQAMGYTAEQCLAGTGLHPQDMVNPGEIHNFTLEQEFRFHRNLLQLNEDPLLGLKLGSSYTLDKYGLLGFAFLSAPTLRHAMTILHSYGPLSFTLFRIEFQTAGATAILRFSRKEIIPQDLLAFYTDRDLAAALLGGQGFLPEPLSLLSVAVIHGASHLEREYESFFGCPVSFGAAHSELRFDATILDAPMPQRDADTSAFCQQQCQLLLARMSKSSGFVDRVRQLIVARPGYFPDIDYIAEKLNMTSRTLRRKLTAEGSSYQAILCELRYQLAQDYLGTSSLPIEEIAVLLGYSSPGNFTNAFKRWHGSSPRQFRQESYQHAAADQAPDIPATTSVQGLGVS